MIQETQEVEGGKVDALVSIDCNCVAGRSARANTNLNPYVLTDRRGNRINPLKGYFCIKPN